MVHDPNIFCKITSCLHIWICDVTQLTHMRVDMWFLGMEGLDKKNHTRTGNHYWNSITLALQCQRDRISMHCDALCSLTIAILGPSFSITDSSIGHFFQLIFPSPTHPLCILNVTHRSLSLLYKITSSCSFKIHPRLL